MAARWSGGCNCTRATDLPIIATLFLAAQEKFKRLEAVLKAESEKKEKDDRSRLPDPPKTAQDIWQQSVIGDYLARFKV